MGLLTDCHCVDERRQFHQTRFEPGHFKLVCWKCMYAYASLCICITILNAIRHESSRYRDSILFSHENKAIILYCVYVRWVLYICSNMYNNKPPEDNTATVWVGLHLPNLCGWLFYKHNICFFNHTVWTWEPRRRYSNCIYNNGNEKRHALIANSLSPMVTIYSTPLSQQIKHWKVFYEKIHDKISQSECRCSEIAYELIQVITYVIQLVWVVNSENKCQCVIFI